jgi:hypothetical protein
MKEGAGKGGIENIMEGVNMFKAHCPHVWNYQNEIPAYH